MEPQKSNKATGSPQRSAPGNSASSGAAAKTVSTQPATPTGGKVPPLFRRIDWLSMLIAFGVVWVVYMLTLAPEVTLQDSGELCTGSFYAGIPHPPGYPFWSIYSWLWTVLLPINNVAWRVEVGEATAAAFACGLVALMVSRGSSMFIESIEELKGLTGKGENVLCLVCGAVAGMLLGFGQVMWSESVAINRISLFGVPWVMMVLLCMMRWIYAPWQKRYLLCAMFLFGISLTIHQTLLCAGLAIEVIIAAAHPRLGRTFFLGNSVIFLGVLLAQISGVSHAIGDAAFILRVIFAIVGIASIAAYCWLAIITKESYPEFCRDGTLAGALLIAVMAIKGGAFFWLLALAALVGFVVFAWQTRKLGLDWLVAITSLALVGAGAAFYLYEPISSMTNPPMNWGYPRTVEGFWHALKRGQYEQPNPSDFVHNPSRFVMQLGWLVLEIAKEFNWVLLFVAIVPLFFFFKMKRRERSWLIGLGAMYMCIGVLLVVLMNPSDDKQSSDLHEVFFTSSHGVVAILIGYGLSLLTAFLVVQYQKFRIQGLTLGAVAFVPAFLAIYSAVSGNSFGVGELQPKPMAPVFIFMTATAILASIAAHKYFAIAGSNGAVDEEQRSSFKMYTGLAAIGLVFSAILAVFNAPTGLINILHGLRWSDAHTYFNEDNLSVTQVLASLPGGLAPKVSNLPVMASVMIFGAVAVFVAALWANRSRAPLMLIFGLFALLPITSAMSHWAGSEQRNHWFGYWFGHDMFTPPFVGPDGNFSYDRSLREQAMKGPKGALVYPEMTRDAILFGGTDPGRFCPTYMIFCESFIPHSQQPKFDQTFDRRDVYIITQNALADGTYLEYIRAHYNRSTQIDPPFFQELLRGTNEVRQNYTTNFIARLAYKWLDKPLTALGARVEARRRKEGVYPPKEIYTPTPDDSTKCFNEYMADVQQRYSHDNDPRFNHEPRQMKPGEIMAPTADGRVTVSGQVSVMAINGLLTKVIFDKNPTNEFFVEESFPLDWMYPYLTPFGIIMKINREPLQKIPEEVLRRDHEFWSKYSERLTGNWITSDTTIKQIADFVVKVHLERNFSDFKGDRRFIRDQEAQKAFSKLRTAIAGIYAWRLDHPTPAEGMAEQQALLKEAEFAFRQAFAFCPYSPEVVFRYAPLLAKLGRIDDAILVTETGRKVDPNNGAITNLLQQLLDFKKNSSQQQALYDQMEQEIKANPTNFEAAFRLASAYLQAQQVGKAMDVLDRVLTNTNASSQVLAGVADAYYKTQNYPKLEVALQKIAGKESNSPENWYNLAAVQSMQGKYSEAMTNLTRSIQESNNRLKTNPTAGNLQIRLITDAVFNPMRALPEFQQLVTPPSTNK